MVISPSPLVGKAVADALGMPFETMKADDPKLLSWDGSYLPSEYHKLRPGQWTDDTMMAKIILESLVSCGGFYPKDLADRYITWYQSGDHRGMGGATRKALIKLTQGSSWLYSGTPDAQGNGTAMRAASFGVFFRDDYQTAAEFARLDAGITHLHTEAAEGSAAIAVAVAMLHRGVSADEIAGKLVNLLHVSKVRDGVMDLVKYQKNHEPIHSILKYFGTSPLVYQTVPSALAAFHFTGSYLDAVKVAIKAGGDTDSTTAVTGALAGTYYGFEGIPKVYRDDLEDLDYLRRLELKAQPNPRNEVGI